MSIFKKITVFMAAAAIASAPVFHVFAEEDLIYEDEDGGVVSNESETYTSGDYEYTVKIGNHGDKVAVLEHYNGSDTEVEVPEYIDDYAVEAFGNYTFFENENITQVTIPAKLEDFGECTFLGCTSITEFKVDEENELYTTDSDGSIVGKQGALFVAYPMGKNPESYTLADGFISINASAFARCSNLKEINFPDTLQTINGFAFVECTALEKITLPESVSEIGHHAFFSCKNLKEINFSEGLYTIGNGAFSYCDSLEVVDLPESLYEVGQGAFSPSGLTSVTIPASLISIGYYAFGFYGEEEAVALDNFVIKGYQNSYGQRYASENGITFVALDADETQPQVTYAQKSEKGKEIQPGTIVAICVAAAAIIAGVILFIVKKSSGNINDTKINDDDDNKDTEDEE